MRGERWEREDEGEGDDDGGDDPVCADTDNGATDSYGDGCAAYVNFPSWCGNYNDDDFVSEEMCCACGGGETTPSVTITIETKASTINAGCSNAIFCPDPLSCPEFGEQDESMIDGLSFDEDEDIDSL